jgi:hypothetical protein
MPVQIETVKAIPIRDASEYVAVVRSQHAVQIQPQVDGHVTRIDVVSGSRVRAGAPLIQIDPRRQVVQELARRLLAEIAIVRNIRHPAVGTASRRRPACVLGFLISAWPGHLRYLEKMVSRGAARASHGDLVAGAYGTMNRGSGPRLTVGRDHEGKPVGQPGAHTRIPVGCNEHRKP